MNDAEGDTTRTVCFDMEAKPGSSVSVAGTFNGWNATTHPLSDPQGTGHFTTSVRVPPGMHEYKFVVDEVWTEDPNGSEWISNDYGSLNSVLHVGDADIPGGAWRAGAEATASHRARHDLENPRRLPHSFAHRPRIGAPSYERVMHVLNLLSPIGQRAP